jgi:hypothetical protein
MTSYFPDSGDVRGMVNLASHSCHVTPAVVGFLANEVAPYPPFDFKTFSRMVRVGWNPVRN